MVDICTVVKQVLNESALVAKDSVAEQGKHARATLEPRVKQGDGG